MCGTCIKTYFLLLTKHFTYKGRVNVGLHVYIFSTVLTFITHALCIISLLHRVSMLTENTYICNHLSMGFVLRLAVIHLLRSPSYGSSLVFSHVRSV